MDSKKRDIEIMNRLKNKKKKNQDYKTRSEYMHLHFIVSIPSCPPYQARHWYHIAEHMRCEMPLVARPWLTIADPGWAKSPAHVLHALCIGNLSAIGIAKAAAVIINPSCFSVNQTKKKSGAFINKYYMQWNLPWKTWYIVGMLRGRCEYTW